MQLFCMYCRNPYEGQGYITFGEERGGEKKDGGLIIVFRKLLRTTESNTELYRGIHYIV